MPTKIYGASDNLIEFEGDVHGEVGAVGADSVGALIVCGDGTMLVMEFVSIGWIITPLVEGDLFDEIARYKDGGLVATFDDGLEWAYVARDYEKVG